MSSKRKKPPRHDLARFDNPECSETSGNERQNDDSPLTFRQQAVLPAIAVSRSIAQAARDSRIAESTLRRWLNEPPFREELNRVRQEYLLLNQHQALGGIPVGMSVIVELATLADDQALRFRAAKFLVERGDRHGDFDRLSDDLQDLQEAIRNSDNTTNA